jgi:tripartite-type tricarboxylate transporter receptor subunit TctC
MFDTLITSIPYLKDGRLRALGVSLSRRSSSLPDVPTIAEAGVRGYEFTAWQSFVVPAGTDKAIIMKIQADVAKVLALPDVRYKLVDQGANEIVGSTPEELGRRIRTDIVKFRKLIADAGLRIE